MCQLTPKGRWVRLWAQNRPGTKVGPFCSPSKSKQASPSSKDRLILVWVSPFNQFCPCCESSHLCDGDLCGALPTFITSRIGHCHTLYIGTIFGQVIIALFWMYYTTVSSDAFLSPWVIPALDFSKQQILVPWRTTFEKWGKVQQKQSDGNQETLCFKQESCCYPLGRALHFIYPDVFLLCQNLNWWKAAESPCHHGSFSSLCKTQPNVKKLIFFFFQLQAVWSLNTKENAANLTQGKEMCICMSS